LGPSLRRLVVLAAILVLAGCGASVLPEVHSDAERLKVARDLMEHRHYPQAIDLLKAFAGASSGSADVDEAIYLLGTCYLRTHDWAMASAEFERLLRDYPESDSAGSASFEIAEALFGQARPPDFDQEYTLKALDQWQKYLGDFPGHWRNGEARMKIAMVRTRLGNKLLKTARLYLKLKLPGPARVYFTRVSVEYGDVGLAGEAQLGLALCDVREGKRADAIERLKQVEAQFAGESVAAEARRERARLEH
jgi:outer membrane protein assembly factor BamD